MDFDSCLLLSFFLHSLLLRDFSLFHTLWLLYNIEDLLRTCYSHKWIYPISGINKSLFYSILYVRDHGQHRGPLQKFWIMHSIEEDHCHRFWSCKTQRNSSSTSSGSCETAEDTSSCWHTWSFSSWMSQTCAASSSALSSMPSSECLWFAHGVWFQVTVIILQVDVKRLFQECVVLKFLDASRPSSEGLHSSVFLPWCRCHTFAGDCCVKQWAPGALSQFPSA